MRATTCGCLCWAAIACGGGGAPTATGPHDGTYRCSRQGFRDVSCTIFALANFEYELTLSGSAAEVRGVATDAGPFAGGGFTCDGRWGSGPAPNDCHVPSSGEWFACTVGGGPECHDNFVVYPNGDGTLTAGVPCDLAAVAVCVRKGPSAR